MAIKKSAAKKISSLEEIKPNPKTMMKDMHAILKNHGVDGRIKMIAMAGDGDTCICRDGRLGRQRVVNGKAVCVPIDELGEV